MDIIFIDINVILIFYLSFIYGNFIFYITVFFNKIYQLKINISKNKYKRKKK